MRRFIRRFATHIFGLASQSSPQHTHPDAPWSKSSVR
jgi:hypothetical protein